MSGAVANRHFDIMFGCFVFDPVSFAFQSVLLGLYRTFFIIGGKKDAVCVALTHVFWITADREMVPISLDASPFHQIGWAEPYLKKAFVRFGLLMIWFSMRFRLLMLWFSIPLSVKQTTQPRSAQILRKILAKTSRSRRNEQSIPPIMKNERPNAERNLLKRERYRPEHKQLHQIPKWRLATCTGFQQTIFPQARGSNHAPPQRIPQGEELESRG